MAAQGTGLPTPGQPGVTPLVDMSGSAGMAERAAADGLAGVAEGIGRLKLALDPALQEHAEGLAARDLAEGDDRPRLPLTTAAEAYNRAIDAGRMAEYAGRIETEGAELHRRFPADPEGFTREALAWRTRFVQEVPGRYAVAVGGRITAQIARLEVSVAQQHAADELTRDKTALETRGADLLRRLRYGVANGQGLEALTDPALQQDLEDLRGVWTELVGNPAFQITDDQARAEHDEQMAGLEAAAVAGLVRRVYREQGPSAALAEIETLLPPMAGTVDRAPSRLTLRGRELARQLSIQAYAEESGLDAKQANIAQAQQTAASQRANSLIEAMRYGGEVDHDELRQAAAASGDPGLIAQANFAIEVGVQPPPGFGARSGGGFDGDASAAGGFDAAVRFVIDDLEGGDAYVPDDNGAGPTRFGINARANPDLDIANLTRRQAEARFRRDYWDPIGADSLPPALAFVAFDASVNQGPADARRWIAESGGDVGRFLALREADYRRLAASDPKHARHLNGWLSRLQKVRGQAARIQAFQNNREGFASDPIAFAVGGASRAALADVPALPVDAVFQPQGQAVWGEVIRARRAVGATLASQYQAPQRMLTNAEVTAYKDRFERDPASAVTFARMATAAIGGDGARDLLAEIGQGGAAPTLIHIADLGRPGGDATFAIQAAQGLAMRAQGMTLPGEEREEIAEQVHRWRRGMRDAPSLLTAVHNSAQAAALADHATGRLRPADYYAQAALGRTTWQGRSYGGGAIVNGVNVIVPRWLNADYFDDALEAMATDWLRTEIGPVHSNGEAMRPRDVARLRPVLMPDGRYRLVDRHGNVAQARGGGVYDVDLEAGRALIRTRLGVEAVRPD